jgi:2-iminobutanoate/2-iminopropanoate deaminase
MRDTPAGEVVDPGHPYSLVRTVDGRTAWTSGIVPRDTDGAVLTDAVPAIARALDLLAERATEAGATLADIVKVTVYLTDLDWRDALNEAFVARFTPPMPARTAVEVRRLPSGSAIELDAVIQVSGPA